MRVFWGIVVFVLVAALSATSAAAADAGPPSDYRELAPQLSQPVYDQTIVERVRIPMADGVEIFAEITRPDPASFPGLKVPVIMSASPYHSSNEDRRGTGNLPGPRDANGKAVGLPGYFPARGYAVAMVDWRGTGHSGGCLDLLGQKDAADLKAVVEWLATRDWSTGRVGAIGLSMPGHAAGVAAAMQPEGLATSVIIAGGGSMYDSQFQRGVPFLAHAASPMWAYPYLTVTRYLPVRPLGLTTTGEPGDDANEDPSTQYATAGCGFTSGTGAAPGAVTGQYVAWHAERDFTKELAAADIPLFVVNGVDDASVRMSAAEWFYANRPGRSTDKVWIGPWGHNARARGEQWTNALHAWFDRHLQQRDVSTGPAVEAFFENGDVFTAPAWAPAEGATWYPDASDMSLDLTPPSASATAAFTSPARADYLVEPPPMPEPSDMVEFTSAPLESDLVLFGLPKLRLTASVTGAATHLVTTLYRQSENGERRVLDVCAIQPQLRNGADEVAPVVPGAAMDLLPQCFTTAHHLVAGDTLVLRVATNSTHHIPTMATDARVTVHTGPDATAYELPVRPDAVTYPDPMGSATP